MCLVSLVWIGLVCQVRSRADSFGIRLVLYLIRSASVNKAAQSEFGSGVVNTTHSDKMESSKN